MKMKTLRLAGLATLVCMWWGSGVRAAPLTNPGDFLYAGIFTGTATNTSGGNPNADGQGWYRKDFTNPLNYYSDPTSHWATATNTTLPPAGAAGYFSEVQSNGINKLRIDDCYWGQLGVGWVYSNQVYGRYVISCTNMVDASYFNSQFFVKTNAGATWVALSGVLAGTIANGAAYTNGLGRGGGLAYKAWNANSAVANAWGTISDLKVTLLDLATNTPAVTLSASTTSFPENPQQGTSVVTVALSQFQTTDVTVNLGFSGTAVLGTDFSASATQLVIAAGDLSGSITLTGIDNAIMTGNRTVTVGISSLINATNGTPVSVSLALTDDEMPLTQKGDVLWASIFFGTATNTSGANPNRSGQAWYQAKTLTNAPVLLNYYTNPTPRWATAVTNPGNHTLYSEVTNITVGANQLRITDNFSVNLGVAWVYTNQVSAKYVISYTNISGANSYFTSQFLTKSNASAPWTAAPVISTGNVVNGMAFTNWLDHGGRLALKVLNNGWGSQSDAIGTVSGLKVTLADLPPRGSAILMR